MVLFPCREADTNILYVFAFIENAYATILFCAAYYARYFKVVGSTTTTTKIYNTSIHRGSAPSWLYDRLISNDLALMNC